MKYLLDLNWLIPNYRDTLKGQAWPINRIIMIAEI